jgi:hypothetical protein
MTTSIGMLSWRACQKCGEELSALKHLSHSGSNRATYNFLVRFSLILWESVIYFSILAILPVSNQFRVVVRRRNVCSACLEGGDRVADALAVSYEQTQE